jgi:ribosomal protein L32E
MYNKYSRLKEIHRQHRQSSSTLRLGVERRGHFVRGMWRPPSLVKKLLSGGDIKVTNGAWQVPKWLAFVASQVVLLGETW